MKHTLSVVALLAACPALADETRQMEAHEHGVAALNIAFDGETVAIEFMAPGADIVGFEYEAETEEDRAAVDEAVATLARPLDLFVLPDAAACSVTQASAELEGDIDHDHDHEHAADEGHGDHDHDHEHDEAAAHDHEHDHEHGEEHAEHDHEEGATHSEFHAEYTLTCGAPEALDQITFAYFDMFENARELEIQVITASGAQAFEVERDAPTLDLQGLF